jgi:hypothetical protein
MAKFAIQAVNREAQGHGGAFRAGRQWPSSAPVEVEVLEQDDDPKLAEGETAVTRRRFGKRSFETMKNDPNLIVRPPGDPFVNAKATEQLLAENEALKKRLAELEGAAGQGGGGEHAAARKRAT